MEACGDWGVGQIYIFMVYAVYHVAHLVAQKIGLCSFMACLEW